MIGDGDKLIVFNEKKKKNEADVSVIQRKLSKIRPEWWAEARACRP